MATDKPQCPICSCPTTLVRMSRSDDMAIFCTDFECDGYYFTQSDKRFLLGTTDEAINHDHSK